MFPHNFAVAVGLQGVVFVFDGFEFSDVEYEPSASAFPSSLHRVRLSDMLSIAMNQSPYLVSLKEEAKFLQCFAGTSPAMLTTDGLITNGQEPGITVRNPSITLKFADCQGCPGFVLAYRNLVQKVKAMEANAAYQSQYASVNTSPDISRQRLVKRELVHFIGLLAQAGVDGFPKSLINELNASNDTIVKLIPDREEAKKAQRKF
jgi:hypothetical protein